MSDKYRAPIRGEIWKEVDPRIERYVRIESVNPHGVKIQTVEFSEKHGWLAKPRTRETLTAPERFNGKRGGYAFHHGVADG